MKKTLFSITVILLLSFLGCSENSSSKLVGKWEKIDNSSGTGLFGMPLDVTAAFIEFTKTEMIKNGEISFKYTIKDKKLNYEFMGMTIIEPFEFTDKNTLILEKSTYKRVKK